ncbi:uncharacterized protein LOC122293609 [Carya illinoinensis]|uniref:uncharacterized protein LOC122293609 n=1 Tax=Carya illinoinensis TaxID=32201 RepID=UPI001C729B8E|nr:uncharacterized protein LOC122293609 [Carya illinoinensis]
MSNVQVLNGDTGATKSVDDVDLGLGLSLMEVSNQQSDQCRLSINYGKGIEEGLDEVEKENGLVENSMDDQNVDMSVQEAVGMHSKDDCGSKPEKEDGEHLGKNKIYLSDSDTKNGKNCLKGDAYLEVRPGFLANPFKEDLQLSVISYSAQHVTVSMSMESRQVVISVVYAKCNHVERRELWRLLQLDAVKDAPWLCLGDFNIIRGEEEHRGGRPRLRVAIDEFNDFIDNCGFADMKAVGSKFSWCNGQRGLARSWSKLDRCLMNVVATGDFPNALCKYMARTTSDHAPLSFMFKNLGNRYGPSSFKFQQMWVSHSNFWEVVNDTWSASIETMGLLGLATKLKKVKIVLKDWNCRVFCHTETKIQEFENKIKQLESQLQEGFSADTEQALLEAKEELAVWMKREETRLSQQVKLRWMEKGEASAQFFKTFVSLNKPFVQEMRCPDGTCLNSPEDIHSSAVDYFSSFLQACAPRDLPDLSNLVQNSILEEDNANLLQLPSIQEVKEAMFSIPVDSSPGPDGFGSGFYKTCCDIVEAGMVATVQELFLGIPIPRFYSASYIVLIPKMQRPTGFDKFRPISLCSVVYKAFSKILVRRLSPILNRIISSEQGAFLPG